MALTPAQRGVFEAPNNVVVSTLAADGSPRSVPVWCEVESDAVIALNGTLTRHWLRNLQRDPRVALTVYGGDDPFHPVTVLGRAIQITATGAGEQAVRMRGKYMGADVSGPEPEDRVLVRIAVERVH